jgi:probable FeS assembly SUF system protein SufT
MNYLGSDAITLSRDVEVVAIPAGDTIEMMKGTEVAITQALGGSYTLMVPTYGGLFRLADKDADAIGKEPRPQAEASTVPVEGEELEKEVWQRLKTCYDPEIPVNIVDLGLVYALDVKSREGGGYDINVQMTLTAPGCGMGPIIASEARQKILTIDGVADANVDLVWDPPWSPDRISEEGKQKLGMA